MAPTAGLTFLRKTFYCEELIQYFLVVRVVVSSIHWVRYTCFYFIPKGTRGQLLDLSRLYLVRISAGNGAGK